MTDVECAASGEFDDGFTLVETLVALAIFALAFAGLYSSFEGGWRSVRQAALRSTALDVAKSKLASAGIEVPLAEGRTTGMTDGIAWEIAMFPHARLDGIAPLPSSVPHAWLVTVTATAAAKGTASRSPVALTTIRLGEKQ